MKLPSCPRRLIINILRKNPDGLTITSIAQLTGMHRHTATKYVYELKGAGVINERDVGSAKLCYLREGLGKVEERKLIGRLNGNGNERSETGQVQILTALLFLFLIPTTAIIAQNATEMMNPDANLILNQHTISFEESDNLSQTLEQENVTQAPEIQQPTETQESNGTVEETQDPTDSEALGQTNETIIEIIPAENVSGSNETLSETEGMLKNGTFSPATENETILPVEGIFENQTIAGENATSETNADTPAESGTTNETSADQPILVTEPILHAAISSPDRITRGESFTASTIVSNTGSGEARNVRLYWEIPEGFEIVSGQAEAKCGTIAPDSECATSLDLSSSVSTGPGESEIRVLVNYEK
jgi:predicted transcriptional regulator